MLMVALYNNLTRKSRHAPLRGYGAWRWGGARGARKCVFAAPAELFGGLGDPLPSGRGQHIRFGRNYCKRFALPASASPLLAGFEVYT